MRIGSGLFGGRMLVAPKSAATRPMSDKVRVALFDALGPLDGWSVLDAYAGSGAVGFEALSRGAGQVVATEGARKAIQAIKANQRELAIGWGYAIYESTIEAYLARGPRQTFELIVADPPYEQLKLDVLEKLGLLLADVSVRIIKMAGLVFARRFDL